MHSSAFLPVDRKLLTIIQALHEDSTAVVRAYGKTSDKFPVSCGVCEGCVLVPTLFNLYFDMAIHMTSDKHRIEGKGIKVAYLHNAGLLGTRRIRYQVSGNPISPGGALAKCMLLCDI